MEGLRVLMSPTAVLARVARDRMMGAALVIVVLWAVIGAISAFFSVGGNQLSRQFDTANLPPDMAPQTIERIQDALQVGVPIASALFPFAWWIVIGLLMHVAMRIFGGRGAVGSTLAVVGVACAPLLLTTILSLPLNVLQGSLDAQNAAMGLAGLLATVLGLIGFVWHVVLVVLGGRSATNITTGESGGACGLTCVGCVGLTAAGAIVVLVLATALAGGA
ncbi:MAG: YIP1 family protein [Chloroflexia bacterium]